MTQALRILVLNERDGEHPKAGGAEIHVERLFGKLTARGHRVVQRSTGFEGGAPQATRAGIEILRDGPLPLYYARLPFRVAASGRRDEFDVVVECLNKVPFYAPLWTRKPVLALCHHLFGEVAFDQVPWPIAAAVFAAERGIPWAHHDVDFLAISPSSRDDLVARGIAPERIRVSAPGIDRPTLTVDPDARRRPILAYVGRLEAYKHVEILLESAARLVPLFPELEVLVIGRGADRPRLEELARRLELERRTRFTGFVPDAERDRLLASAAACVFPSQKEGFGLTVVEANALATPVVARDAPGLRDSIRDGETGHLVAGGDPADYARALAPLLADGDEARGMRRRALAWSAHFDWDRAADELLDAIEAAIARGPRGGAR
ncbi:glycosyltransferase family 4 protein [Myxococcota bacterium]|nr:glycosyltransferase family 4 protein [Myxococcota bacterium]